MSANFRAVTTSLLITAIIFLSACSGDQQDVVVETESEEAAALAQMEARVADLQRQVDRIKSSNDIKRLQRIFGYYFDEGLWDEMVNLFTEDASLEYARDGVYEGRDRIREYFYTMGSSQQGLLPGELNEHFQLMPVVTLSEDGMTAKGRWRDIILKGMHGEWAWWGEGPYENEYVMEDGVWKISRLHWFQTIMVPYEGGWGENEDVNAGIYVSGELPPDGPMTIPYEPWPETFLPPFHFDNPVETYVPEEVGQ